MPRARSDVAPSQAWTPPDGLADLLVSGEDLLVAGEKPVAWAVEGLFESTDTILLSGREKDALKTMVCLDLAIARILGASWLGFQVRRGAGRVLFVSTETGAAALGRRIRLLARGRGIDPAEVVPFFKSILAPVSMIPVAEIERRFTEHATRAQATAGRIVDSTRREAASERVRADAETAALSMGQNLRALGALHNCDPGTWSLVILDTLRGCLEGNESDSGDARRFTQATRDLARKLGAPVVSIHHNNKGGDAGDSRSARGSTELTAGPECLVTIDTSGEHPTASFKLRNHAAPPAVGYALAVEPEKLRIERREPAANKASGDTSPDDVLAVFEEHGDAGLTLDMVRRLVAKARGGKKGAKASQHMTRKHVERLLRQGAISECKIAKKNGDTFDGYRLGAEGGTVPATHVDGDEGDRFTFAHER